jgi:hypothetical protein
VVQAKVLKKSTPKELARELQRKEKEKEKAQEAKEKAQEAKEKEKDKKADKKGEHWHHHASNAEKDDGFLFQEHFELPEEEPPEPPRKRPTSLKERMAANIRKSSGRRLLVRHAPSRHTSFRQLILFTWGTPSRPGFPVRLSTATCLCRTSSHSSTPLVSSSSSTPDPAPHMLPDGWGFPPQLPRSAASLCLLVVRGRPLL